MDRKFEREKRYVLVVIESTSAHPSTLPSKLSNIQLVFQQSIPSPLRWGIVKNLKHNYRSIIINKEVNVFDLTETNEQIDVLEAMTMLAESWEGVSINTIVKSFVKSGWVQESAEIEDDSEDEEIKIGAMFKTALRIVKLDVNTYMDYLSLDDHVATSGVLTDEDICKIVTENARLGSGTGCVDFEEFHPPVIVKVETFHPELSSKPTRQTLSHATKLEIIRKKETTNVKNVDLCMEYGVSKSAMGRLLQTGDELKARLEINPFLIDCKKFRRTKEPKLEEALSEWIKEVTDTKELTQGKVREKAMEIADQLGIKDFKGSNGNFEKLKLRRYPHVT
jgi:DDE superfamily endonuclease/Tc5 transposase DNA-binding domain